MNSIICDGDNVILKVYTLPLLFIQLIPRTQVARGTWRGFISHSTLVNNKRLRTEEGTSSCRWDMFGSILVASSLSSHDELEDCCFHDSIKDRQLGVEGHMPDVWQEITLLWHIAWDQEGYFLVSEAYLQLITIVDGQETPKDMRQG